MTAIEADQPKAYAENMERGEENKVKTSHLWQTAHDSERVQMLDSSDKAFKAVIIFKELKKIMFK